MAYRISPPNLLFMLAYSFDLRWDYLEKEVDEESLSDAYFFELLVFLLLRWTKELVRHGLYKTYVEVEEELRRIRGRIALEPYVKTGARFDNKVFCRFDDLSFDVLENQIILSTLCFAKKELGSKQGGFTGRRRKSRERLQSDLQRLVRLLSTEITRKPLNVQLFHQLLFHRMNLSYKPIIQVCKFIFDCAASYQKGEASFLDVPEEKLSEVFERFLRNYLCEYLRCEGLKADKGGYWGWLVGENDEKVSHMPSIKPDIVIRDKGIPRFVIDAKFYKSPVYKVEAWYSDEEEEARRPIYKTHSHNLYQLIAYTDYLNCDGLLVYAQTETGSFKEMVRLDTKYYANGGKDLSRFGFMTLDLSGELEDFKKRMEDFAEEIREYCH